LQVQPVFVLDGSEIRHLELAHGSTRPPATPRLHHLQLSDRGIHRAAAVIAPRLFLISPMNSSATEPSMSR
jgi:hypothetical protein